MMIEICQFGIFTPTSFIKLRCEEVSFRALFIESSASLMSSDPLLCRSSLLAIHLISWTKGDCSGVRVKGTRPCAFLVSKHLCLSSLLEKSWSNWIRAFHYINLPTRKYLTIWLYLFKSWRCVYSGKDSAYLSKALGVDCQYMTEYFWQY